MCGIAGFVARALPESAPESVRAMANSLARRGPDAEGFHAWPNAVLGHRRLEIFDLSDAGRQPMLSADAQVGVVFNGAIYNFQELRAELEQRGHRFRSQTDTEILVEGYLAWGIDDLLARLRGMFAFALWDNRSAALYLVRDRLGVKPLLYFEDGNALVFASTAAALRASGCVDELDDQAVVDFLEFGFVTDSRTIFHGARKLAAGHLLEWRNGVSRVRAYWALPAVDQGADRNSNIGFEEAVEETQRLLLDSVKVRLFADVPVGALLSAGIDSTLICWAMSKLNANIKSCSVGAPGDPADESVQAAATARQLGIPHEVIELPSDRPPSLDDLTSAYAEPFACPSALGMLSVSQAVKPAITVLLTGDGGDDVFLGYPFQRHMWMAQRAARALPRPAASVWRTLRPLVDHLPGLRRPKHFLDYATGGLGAVTRVHDGLPFYLRSGLLGERLAGLSGPRARPLSFASARNLLPEVLAYQQDTVFTGEFMTKVDGGTMHYALEARSPLLDQRVWEFAARLPFSLRLRGGELKAVLREIVRRQVSPEVASRPKRGFTVPVERWLATRWKTQLESMLDAPLLQREGWIRPGALEPVVRASLARQYAPLQLWYLVVLENWLRHKAIAVSPRPAPALC